MAAVHESDEMELRIGRVGPDRAEDIDQREREARAVAAAVLKASPERIVLTHGAAEAARLVALEVLDRSAPSSAQRVVMLEGLDRAVAAAIRDVAEVAGAEVEVLPEAPRILAPTWPWWPWPMSMPTGAWPTPPTGRRVRTQGRSAPARRCRAERRCHADRRRGAWLPTSSSPRAIAGCWAPTRWPSPGSTPDLDEELPEWLRQATAPFARGSLLALARSVGWLLMYVELPWAIDRTVELADRSTTTSPPSTAWSCSPPRTHTAPWPPSASPAGMPRASPMSSRAASSPSSRPTREADVIRASVGAWNRESELERFVERVAELAAHTPETLPRRPSLTVISGPIDPEEDCVTETPEDRGPARASADPAAARSGSAPSGRSAGGRLATPRRRSCGRCSPTWPSRWSAASSCCSPTGWPATACCRAFVLDLGPLVYVIVVIVSGSLFTYLWVELPTGVPGEKRSSPWAAVLGFFASIPIVYLALVVIFEVLRPLLP